MRKSISQNVYVEDGLYSKNEIANEIRAGWVEHTEGTGLNYNFISCSYCCLISGTIWIEVFTIHKNPKIQNRRQMNTGQRLISECGFLHIFMIFSCIRRNTPDQLPIMFIFDKVTQTLVVVRINTILNLNFDKMPQKFQLWFSSLFCWIQPSSYVIPLFSISGQCKPKSTKVWLWSSSRNNLITTTDKPVAPVFLTQSYGPGLMWKISVAVQQIGRASCRERV